MRKRHVGVAFMGTFMRRLLLTGFAAASMLAACDSRPEDQGGQTDGRFVREEVANQAELGLVGGFAADASKGGEFDLAQAQPAAPAAPPPPAPEPAPDAAPQPDGQSAADDIEQAASMLAYSYGATLQLPARNVRAVMTNHEEVCRAAGPSRCQLLSANVNESGPDYVYGYLSLRAEPTWLETFREGLEADAEGAEGRLTGQTVYAEDLTRLIVDTEARLRAQRTLRQSLEELLQRQTDDVGDLLAVERELARVQGDIDSQTSQLEVMRRRVEMSTLDISYQPAPAPFSENAFTPLGDALNDFFGVFAEAAGLIVSLVAFVLPFLIVVIPAGWALRRWWRARRAKRLAAKAAPTPA